MASEGKIAQTLLNILNGSVDIGGRDKHGMQDEYNKIMIGKSVETKMTIGLTIGFGSCFAVIFVICMLFYCCCNVEEIKARTSKCRDEEQERLNYKIRTKETLIKKSNTKAFKSHSFF